MSQKFNRSVSMLCWAYNEEESILEFLHEARALMEQSAEKFEIILVDDGSVDRTYEIATHFQKSCPQLRVLKNDKNRNVAYSYRRAINETKTEFLFSQTIDWSYDLSNLRQYLALLESYDVVQGVRRAPVKVKIKLFKPVVALMNVFGIKHLTRRSDTVPKAIISIVNFILIRILFRTPLSDFQNIGFFKTSWFQQNPIQSDSAFGSPETLIKAYWQGLSIKEVPINFIPRTKGDAKGTRFKSIYRAIRDIFKFWFQYGVMGRLFIKKGRIVKMDPVEWTPSAQILNATQS